MRERKTWQALWRAAHAVGAVGLVALAAALFLTLPARAQDPRMDGVEPCLQTHFDPARYVAELQGLGWAPVAEVDRAAALDRLADAFLPLSDTGFDYATAGDLDALRAGQRQRWDELTAGRNILVRGGQTLFIGGDTNPDGRMRVSCWYAAPQDDVMMADLFTTWTRTEMILTGPTVTRAAVPATPMPNGAELEVFAARATPEAAAPAVATQGLLIRVTIAPAGATDGGAPTAGSEAPSK